MLREFFEREASVARQAAHSVREWLQSSKLVKGHAVVSHGDAPKPSTGAERPGGSPAEPARDVPPQPPM